MRVRLLIVRAVAACSLLAASAALAQPPGQAPTPSLAFRDLQTAFGLPPLKDGQDSVAGRDAAKLQVIIRARRLGLTMRSAEEAWSHSSAQYKQAQVRAIDALQSDRETVFTGTRASELNRMLRSSPDHDFRVTSPQLVIDEPIALDRDGQRLNLGEAALVYTGPAPYIIHVTGVRNVSLVGGAFRGSGSGVLVSESRDVAVVGARFIELRGNGIVVTHSHGVVVWGNRFTRLQRAPVLLHGGSDESVVAHNTMNGDLGPSNWHAGVVVTDRNVDLARDPAALFDASGYWVAPAPIPERKTVPQHNIIAFNTISQNRASGIYLDGAVEEVVVGNVITGNAKEGLCLDNGSTANVVAMNLIQQNGQRWGNSDDDLKRDFVLGFGRLPDGTAAAKVPGISIDNAVYNIIYANEVDGNFGGGVKMVRTGYFNVIGLNTLVDNNEGQGPKFHFFGIELGAASADAPATDLDFTPSQGNIIFANTVRGSHYAGVFFAPGSSNNDVFDNTVFGAKEWAMESAVPQDNAALNNLSNQPSRNIDPGIDARLHSLSAGRFDTPAPRVTESQ